ncbi:hypothetical protein FHS83_003043 [Rhizomicrobium palustre]|uniref:DUF3667 domain-containing protein n=1 Tax=Rhizomicrobium palustre TaxID=189966 RepID=A0A846N2L4_9PROT|nr:DUF3667 domain-containing protein [Rhizomicrobium palustre]NIK89725.1 hypothetical protein [Rhizomicrobium palustre]
MDEFEAILETGGAAAVELAASAVAERGGKTVPCPNCQKPMIGPFCALCGQPLNTHRRSLGRLLHEIVKDVASFDSRILRTAKALMIQPGELPKAFREGRTQRYVPSVRLYFFVSLLFFLFLSFTGIALMQFNLVVKHTRLTHDGHGQVFKEQDGKREKLEGFTADKNGKLIFIKAAGDEAISTLDNNTIADGKLHDELSGKITFFHRVVPESPKDKPFIDKKLDEARSSIHVEGDGVQWIKKGLDGTLERLKDSPAALNDPLTTWIPRILFVLLPLFAILLAIFYRRQRKHFLFVDHLVFSLTMHSFVFVVLIGAALAAQVMSAHWVARLTLGVLALYLFLSLKVFYGQGWVKTGLKFTGIAFIYAVFFLVPALVFALAASVFGA